MSEYVDGSKKVGCFTGCLVLGLILVSLIAATIIFV